MRRNFNALMRRLDAQHTPDRRNHHGADCVQSLAAGLASYIQPKQLEA